LSPEVRRSLLIFAATVTLIAVGWASFFETIPPAEFSLQNGTDPKTLDPARATGSIEGRVLYELFEGLLQMMPEGGPDPVTRVQAMTPQPGMAASYDLSEDRRRYTFHLRDDVRWTDGSPVTSHDFAWSWQRFLHPATACEYTFHLHGVPYAKAYSGGTVNVGDRVEVELFDREGEVAQSRSRSAGGSVARFRHTSTANFQHYPRGTMRYGTLTDIRKPPEPSEEEIKADKDAVLKWTDAWIYVVDVVAPGDDQTIDWDGSAESMSFATDLEAIDESAVLEGETIQRTHHVLVAFEKLGGLETPDDRTFVVNLIDPIPYFPNIVAFYPLFPVNRRCVETHGSPLWTTVSNIVTNGPYQLEMRRLRDRLRVVKYEDYYNADKVAFRSVDFLLLEGQNTAVNMYETDQIQWVTDPPPTLLDNLKVRDDFYNAPQLSVYFYRLNVKRPPLDNPKIRRAIAMAIDRKEIVEEVMKVGQIPAFSAVPPGLAGYESAKGFEFDVEGAKKLLAEAGFPGGRGVPKLTILYNTTEGHRSIAEVIQQQLQNNLNISIELQNMEWGSFLDKIQQTDFQIARGGWIADYPDPNTFLDLWVTGGPQNNTNWSNQAFDDLIAASAREPDPKVRLDLLRSAEQIWIDEMPVIPIYFYTSINLVKTNVKGFAPTAQDIHPIQLMSYEE